MQQGRRRRIRKFVAIAVSVAAAAALWLGLLPQRFSPFAPLELNRPESWFLDFRIAALNNNARDCDAAIAQPLLDATRVADHPIENGCGWHNAVRLRDAGGVRLSSEKITCGMSAALAMWLAHEVRSAAQAILKSDVRSIRHLGVYACRNILGSPKFKGFRSQHATANAIDIEGFVLADGRTISILKHWKGNGAEARFLRAVHDRACRYFRVALGPDYNEAHANHFHFDRGALKRCR